jgi:hypothetical protein
LLKKDYLRWEAGRFCYTLITKKASAVHPMALKDEVLAYIKTHQAYFAKPRETTTGSMSMFTVQFFSAEADTQRDRRLGSILQLGVLLGQLKEKKIDSNIQNSVKEALKNEIGRLNELCQDRLCLLFSMDIGKEVFTDEFITAKTSSGSKKEPPKGWLQRLMG